MENTAMGGKFRTIGWTSLLTTALGAGSLIAFAVPASAQDTVKRDQDKTDAADTPTEVELPQIDVYGSIGQASDDAGFASVAVSSATRTGTPITSIPRSIGVVTQEVIKSQQLLTIGEAVRNLAGVSVLESGGVQQIYIRGYGSSNSLTNGFIEPGLVNRPLGPVERLEVLRGPASILVGNQPAGGVLNVILKKPSSVPIHAVTLNAGSRGFVEGLVDLGGPLSNDGNLTFRLNGQLTRADHGYGGYNGTRKYSIAPVVGVKIGAFDLIAGLEHFYNRTPADAFSAAFPVFIPFSSLDPRDPNYRANITALQAANRNIFAKPENIGAQVIGNRADGSRIRSLRGYYEATLNLGAVAGVDLTLRSRAQSGRTKSRDASYIPTLVDTIGGARVAVYDATAGQVVFDNDGIQNDVVATLKTGPIRHIILAGLDYQHQTRDFKIGQSYSTPFDDDFNYIYDPFPNFSRPTLTGPYVPFNLSKLSQTGVLVQDQMDIFDRLHILLSTRFNHYDTSATQYNGNQTTRTSGKFKKQAYNVGATFDVTDWLTPYASYSRGFRPSVGGVSRGPDGVTGIPLPPEESNQYEIGAKSLLLDDRMSITLSAFDIKTKNTPLPAPSRPGDRQAYAIPGVGQLSRGIEFELAGAIMPGWDVLLTGTYQKVKGTQSELAAGANRNVAVAVPKYTGNLWTTYQIRDGALNGLGAGIGEYVVSEIFGSNVRIPPYALTKATIFYKGFKQVQLSATLENAFDKRYYQPTMINSYVPIGLPRSFLITATAGF